MKRIVILGIGYVGSRFARSCFQNGDEVTAISRDPAKIVDWGIASKVIQHDWSEPKLSWRIDQSVDLLLCAVSHRIDSNAAGERSNVHSTCLANILGGFAMPPKRIIYLSTTGVYHSTDSGDLINEESPCQPERPGAQNAYDAEKWLTANLPETSVILRPAGIYGPGRIPNLDALRAGEPIAANPQSYLNLIHVDDLVQVISHVATAQNVSHSIYNVADGTPVLRSDYYSYLTQKIAAPQPKYAPKSSSKIRGRGQGCKRIVATRLRQDFSIPWIYPNYKIGLETLLS